MIPAGTVVTITGKNRGLAIETRKCRHCGMRARVHKLTPSALDLLPAKRKMSARNTFETNRRIALGEE